MAAASADRDPLTGFAYALEPGDGPWTMLLLHGTGGDERDLLSLGRQLAPQATLLAPRGQVMENGVTRRFFARRGPNDIDVEDMLARSDELSTFVREATAEHQLDPDRIVALGYSNGANIALATLLAQPQLFHAAVLLRPVLYHKPDPLPELSGMDILALAGARDPYTPPEVLKELASVLEQCHANLDLQVNAAAGHQLAQADLVHAARWTEGLLARIDAGDRSAT